MSFEVVNKILVFSFSILAVQAIGQTRFEFGIKPSEAVFNNYELNAAFGGERSRYGILFSYRPDSEDGGEQMSIGTGSIGGYGDRHFNKLYTSYTLGIYYKAYLFKSMFFAEGDVFYRNWHFDKKYTKFNNVEGYRFEGIRTENIDVYGLKLLLGRTFFLTNKDKKCVLYLDAYSGAGVRKAYETYETFDGTVSDNYYSYKLDRFDYFWPTFHIGFRLGLVLQYLK